MRRGVALAARASAAAAAAAAATEAPAAATAAAAAAASSSSSASAASRMALPALLQSLAVIGGPQSSSSSGRTSISNHHKPPPAAAAAHARSLASSSSSPAGGNNNDDDDARPLNSAGIGGRPPLTVTDAQFTSEQEERQQRNHRAASLRASMDALVDGAVEAVELGELGRAVMVLERGLALLSSEHGEAPELGELHNQAALLLLLQSSGDGGGDDDDEGGEEQGGSGGGAARPPPLARAAEHATQALRLTERAFGAAHPLTGHRLLRLGTIRLAQGRAADAAPLLAAAADMLGGGDSSDNNKGSGNTAFGPGLAEARFHLALLPVGAATTSSAVAAAGEPLHSSLSELVSLLGPDSMIVRLALAQHSAAVGQGMERAAALMPAGAAAGGAGATGGGSGSAASLALGEALLKQHAALQEARDPAHGGGASGAGGGGGAELGLARYQLAVLYYAHGLIGDAGEALARAREALVAHIPAGHDVDHLMRHRAGMLAAARGDARAAEQLLAASRAHYAAQAREIMMMAGEGGGQADGAPPPPTHPLQREADFGLALCKLRALVHEASPAAGGGGGEGGGSDDGSDTHKDKEAVVSALLVEAAAARHDVARALGSSHLLSLGAARCEARARAMVQEKLRK